MFGSAMTKQKLKQAKRRREAAEVAAAAALPEAATKSKKKKKCSKSKLDRLEDSLRNNSGSEVGATVKKKRNKSARQSKISTEVDAGETPSKKLSSVDAAQDASISAKKGKKRKTPIDAAEKAAAPVTVEGSKKRKKPKSSDEDPKRSSSIGSGVVKAKTEEAQDDDNGSYPSSSAWRQTRDEKNKLKVFVGGIPFSVDLDTLQKDFAECGEIDDFAYPKNEWGGFKGMAFFTFKTQEAVEKALAYDGDDYYGRTLKVGRASPLKTPSRDDATGKSKGKGKGKSKA